MMRLLDPKYIPLLQKPYCCSVACLQMILYRKGFGLYDQEEMAIKFGIRINEVSAHAFSPEMPLIEASESGYGLSTVDSEGQINMFLRGLDVPLIAKSVKYSEIESLGVFLESNFSNNVDVWIEYHAHKIHSYDDRQGKYAHDGLIEGFDATAGQAIVIDPMPEHRQRIRIPFSDIEMSISSHFGKETGFILVKEP